MGNKLDDMLYELALSANKPRYWAERLRKEVRDLRRSASAWDNIGTGIKVPWIEAFGGRFDTLPHEAAMLFLPPGLTVPTATWTDVVGYDDPYTLDPDLTASHTWGFKVDAANGYIYVENVPKESLIMVAGWGDWDENSTGQRGLRWKSDDGSQRSALVNAADGAEAGQLTVGAPLLHFRPLPAAHTFYRLQAYQSSGGDLDLNWCGFVVVRLT